MRKTSVLIIVSIVALACSKDEAGRFFLKGNVALDKGNYKEAIQMYTEAIEKDPQYKDAYNNRGVAHFREGRYQQAINDYDQSLQIDPDYTEAYYNRGMARAEVKLYDAGIQDIQRVLERIDSAYVYFTLGLIKTAKKDYPGALQAFDEVIHKEPGNAKALVNKANIYYHMANHQLAKKHLEQALKLDSKEPYLYNTRALILIKEEKLHEALKQINTAIEIDPGNPYFLNNRGYIHLLLENLEQAEEDINRGIKGDPENAWAYRNKGFFYLKNGNYEAAIRNLELAIQYDKSIEKAHQFLGNAFWESGNKEEACNAWKTAADHGEKEAAEALAKFCH